MHTCTRLEGEVMEGLIHDKEGGFRSVPLVDYEGVFVRDGWGPDIGVMKEWPPVYKCAESRIAGHTVLDIGANIGMFSRKAIQLGAMSAACYEPEPGAFSVLSENMRDLPASLVNAAVGTTPGEAILSVAPSGNATSATTEIHLKTRQHHRVERVAFDDIIDEHKPTLLKCDCEGSELGFLDGKRLPSHVKLVLAELHRDTPEWEEQCARIIRSFDGWKCFRKPVSYSFHRCWLIYYER